jgi:hypothetical protein
MLPLKEFVNEFCNDDGSIDWDKFILFNSGKKQPKRSKKRQAPKGKN